MRATVADSRFIGDIAPVATPPEIKESEIRIRVMTER